jgi:ABC-type dipeptide/oligopeptide/nickel transport system ATPase component
MLRAGLKKISLTGNGIERVLLNDISFHLESNTINVILGKNGSGKSTLIRAMTGLLDKRFYKISGEVFLDKTDLLALPEADLLKVHQEKIRYVFQDAINSFDPLKKIGYYFREYINSEEPDALLEDFLLPERAKLFSLYPYEISGGMAQRLLIILALIARPRILILDEPTSGIDIPISNLILIKLKEFVQENDNAVLLVTQDLQFAKSAGDRIAYLTDSRLSRFFPVPEFFENNTDRNLENFISAFNQLQ